MVDDQTLPLPRHSACKSLIINSPYERPTHHWRKAEHGGARLELVAGRRPAGYDIFDTRNHTTRWVALAQVALIRERVDAWRTADYPGVTAISRQLLAHWRDPQAASRAYPLYFCQIEAIETLIWQVEASSEFTQGVAVPGDGGPWPRLCCKMATGSGKTTVMAMIVVWQVLNALAYPRRNKDFSRAVFVVAPGLTVKERLQVLQPGHPDNAYDAFALCPNEALRRKLNQAEVLIENWHSLMPRIEADRSVVKKGAESDEAFARRVLGRLAAHRDLLVLNDEAHHAYRKPAELKLKKSDAEALGIDLDEATRWIEGLDRIHRTRRIAHCLDVSATPFAPTGKTSTEQALFDWVVSDFGLNDAIEAGLVKTPRVVVRDDALPSTAALKQTGQYRSKLYHLYREPEVAEDLNRRGAQPADALPQLVQEAFTLLGADWRATYDAWTQAGHTSPPVLLTVCNRTETAARVERYLTQESFWPELRSRAHTLRVDSRVLDKAERGEAAAADAAYEAVLREIVQAARIAPDRQQALLALKKEQLLRAIVDHLGQRGSAGQDVRSVVSVAMLSEGWDAKNVTHIMGLRAFTSQLLCEQVIGRGLRRVSYDTESVVCPDGVTRALFKPEFVNVFGVPLSVFQDGDDAGEAPPPPKPSVQVQALPERAEFDITWPNVLRVDAVLRRSLALDLSQVPALRLDPANVHVSADLAPALEGTADLSQAVGIDLVQQAETFRLQRVLFLAAHKALAQLHGVAGLSAGVLVQQLVRLVERFVASDRIEIPSQFHQAPARRRLLLALSVDALVAHVVAHVELQNQEQLEPIFDPEFPIGSTRAMRTWFTTKPCLETTRSAISHAVADSGWEHYTAQALERHPAVQAYAKNDHLGFEVHYLWRGSRRRFVPDYLIRLCNGVHLVLEIKGEDSEQNRAKRLALARWVEAVNARGGFGRWAADVVLGEPAQLNDVLARHAAPGVMTNATQRRTPPRSPQP